MFLHANEVKLVSFKLDYYKYRTGNITLWLSQTTNVFQNLHKRRGKIQNNSLDITQLRESRDRKWGKSLLKIEKQIEKWRCFSLSAIILIRKYIRLDGFLKDTSMSCIQEVFF